jgi:hypothetical protein
LLPHWYRYKNTGFTVLAVLSVEWQLLPINNKYKEGIEWNKANLASPYSHAFAKRMP